MIEVLISMLDTFPFTRFHGPVNVRDEIIKRDLASCLEILKFCWNTVTISTFRIMSCGTNW